MDDKQRDALRKPFPASAIGKLPKGGVWLDYVGHAATTDRLLSVDPGWTWEPFAIDDRGLPRLDESGGLWIRMTVCGVTRVGYGDNGGKKGPNGIKEAIGDAIRNCAMRFGVALDLWAKEDLSAVQSGQAAEPPPQQSNGNGNGNSNGGSRAQGLSSEMLAVRTRVSTAGKALGFTVPQINEDFARENAGLTIPSASVEQLTGYAEDLESRVTAGASS